MLFWRVSRHVLSMGGIVLLGGLISATMVRLAPGFDTDERQLDPSLSADSVRALQSERAGERNILRYYAEYLQGAAHGDFGVSHALGQPVRTLLQDRWPITLRVAGIGLLLGWLLATALAFGVSLPHLARFEILGTTLSGTFLCIPAAALALLSVIFNSPGYLAIGLIVFPKIYRYSRNLLAKAYAMPHITAARAKGLGEIRILVWHVLPVAGPQLSALAGTPGAIRLGARKPI